MSKKKCLINYEPKAERPTVKEVCAELEIILNTIKDDLTKKYSGMSFSDPGQATSMDLSVDRKNLSYFHLPERNGGWHFMEVTNIYWHMFVACEVLKQFPNDIVIDLHLAQSHGKDDKGDIYLEDSSTQEKTFEVYGGINPNAAKKKIRKATGKNQFFACPKSVQLNSKYVDIISSETIQILKLE